MEILGISTLFKQENTKMTKDLKLDLNKIRTVITKEKNTN